MNLRFWKPKEGEDVKIRVLDDGSNLRDIPDYTKCNEWLNQFTPEQLDEMQQAWSQHAARDIMRR